MALILEATVVFPTDIAHSKKKGFRSGYQPQHRFSWADWSTSGEHDYGDDRLHYAGETLRALITFWSWEHYGDPVHPGDEFDILEGSWVVGHGVVVDV